MKSGLVGWALGCCSLINCFISWCRVVSFLEDGLVCLNKKTQAKSPTQFPVNTPATWFHALCGVLRKHNNVRAADILPLCKDNLCYYTDRAW